MPKVLFTIFRKHSHSLYHGWLDHPPKGYKYYTLDDFVSDDTFVKMFPMYKGLAFDIYMKIKRNAWIVGLAKKNKIDIIYSNGVLLYPCSIPWVVDFESEFALVGYRVDIWKYLKHIVPWFLRAKSLKAILPWTEAGAKSLRVNMTINDDIERKIRVIHLCRGRIDPAPQKIKHDSFTLLFVGSVNSNAGEDFFAKGGLLAVEAFKRLKKRVPGLKLILRTNITKKYERLRRVKGIEIWDQRMPSEEYAKLFLRSDVFFYPTYQCPAMTFLDAMNYALPIITTDIYANPEHVKNGWNGFLVKFPKRSNVWRMEKLYGLKFITNGMDAENDKLDEKMIADLCEKVMILYKDRKLLEEMGANSRRLLENQFSLENRNQQLKEVYDCILKG